METPREHRAYRIASSYLAGATLEEAARAEDVSPMTAMRDLNRLGIERRKPAPAPDQRECARLGCTRMFQPTRRQLNQGYGKFCSRKCAHEAQRIHAKPQ